MRRHRNSNLARVSSKPQDVGSDHYTLSSDENSWLILEGWPRGRCRLLRKIISGKK